MFGTAAFRGWLACDGRNGRRCLTGFVARKFAILDLRSRRALYCSVFQQLATEANFVHVVIARHRPSLMESRNVLSERSKNGWLTKSGHLTRITGISGPLFA